MSETALNRFEQAIKPPGRRLGTGIPLRTVRRAWRGDGARAVSFELPLVPFIDFLLCIVLFLLASFSASGQSLDQPVPPQARNSLPLLEAPVVAVVGTQILVDGASVGSIHEITETHRLQYLPSLRDALTAKRTLWEEVNPGQQFPGVVLIHADGELPAVVVKSVFQTAAASGYPNVSFVVRASRR